jgi:hypothetical protein
MEDKEKSKLNYSKGNDRKSNLGTKGDDSY